MTTHAIGRAEARRGLLLVVLAGVLWGTSDVATKTIYSFVAISPVMVAAMRLTLGAPLLWAALRLTNGTGSLRIARGDLVVLLVAGASLGLSQACYFAAIARVGVAMATLVTICMAPLLVSISSAALLGERLPAAVACALAVALVGLVLLIGMGQAGTTGGPVGTTLPGILLALAAACCFAAFILVSRVLAPRYHPLLSITFAVCIGAVLLLAIVGLSTGFTVRYPGTVWALFLYLGLVPTALGYALFYQGVRQTTAAEASIASLTEPLTSTVLALLLFGERLGPLGWAGALLLIGAIVFLYRKGAP